MSYLGYMDKIEIFDCTIGGSGGYLLAKPECLSDIFNEKNCHMWIKRKRDLEWEIGNVDISDHSWQKFSLQKYDEKECLKNLIEIYYELYY